MELYWKSTVTHDYNDGPGLDLDDVWQEPDVFDEETFKLAILHHIALWALEQGQNVDDVVGYTLDNDGDEVEIDKSSTPWEWLDNIVNLYCYIQRTSGAEVNLYLAEIKYVGWSRFTWDNMDEVRDNYEQDWSGDYEEYGRDGVDSIHGALSETLDQYFDYDQFGRDLIDDRRIIEFAGDEFLMYE